MSKISDVLAVPASGAYYYEDLSALQSGGAPLDEGDTASLAAAGTGIRRGVAEAVSFGLVLEDGRVAWGDCVAVAYSGKAGRAPAFRAALGVRTIREVIAPVLRGRPLDSFRELAAEVDALTEIVEVFRPLPSPPAREEQQEQGQPDEGVEDQSRRALLTSVARLLKPFPDEERAPKESPRRERVREEHPLHPAVRYGVSQALLKAVALERGITMAEVIAHEWDLPRPDAAVPLHAQSGRDRYMNADKMIVRRIPSLPHGLVDNIDEQVGLDGGNLLRYVRWLNERIQELGGGYRPTIHLDLHGALGQISENNLGKVLGALYAMELAAQPQRLRIESPVIMETREAQIDALKTLRNYIDFRKMQVQLVADEWANTLEDVKAFISAEAADMIQIKMPDLGSLHNSVEAVLACKAGGVGAFLGGSCAETDLSARVSVHVALATRPDLLMAKPGLGVDEAITITQNEMARTLAWLRRGAKAEDH
jgi:methylaspartate ammonia-lyase